MIKAIFAFALLFCLIPRAEAEGKRGEILATIFPVYDMARTVAGSKASVRLLTPPGAEAHSFEPKPSDIIAAGKAQAFIYTNDVMEPWAKRFAASAAGKGTLIIEAGAGIPMLSGHEEEADGHHHGGHRHTQGDPHIWLDFDNASKMADNIARGLGEKDPANKEYYAANAAQFAADLKKLDGRYKTALASCKRRDVIYVGHFAFAYMAKRYNLAFTSAQGVMPEAEPTPAKLAALTKQLKKSGAKYVFAEDAVSGRFAAAVAGETGAAVLRLNPAHEIKKNDFASGAGFISIMDKNLATLEQGLECGKR